VPGFEPEEIDLAWDEGVLNVAAEHVDESRGCEETYHRRFRFPKAVDDEAITASYNNGVLEVEPPVTGRRPGERPSPSRANGSRSPRCDRTAVVLGPTGKRSVGRRTDGAVFTSKPGD